MNLTGLWSAFRSRRVAITASIAFAVAMLVYLQTLLPGVEFYDTGEYQAAPYVLGNVHQTGYPLYPIVGKIFGTLVPIGSFAFRMNLMSALFTAAMAALLVVLSFRYGVSMVVALAAALGFAFAQNVWRSGSHADPHPMTALMVAVLWLLALKWKDTGERRWLWTAALLSGLGLGGAAVVVAELPAIIIYTSIARPREFFAPKTMIVAALLGIGAGVGIYAYLPIRAMMNAPMNYWNPQTWEAFRGVVFSGAGFLTSYGLGGFISTVPQIVDWYGEWLTPAGRILVAALALIGFGALLIRDWRLACAIAIGFLLPMYAAVAVPNMERGRYFMMSNWLLFFAAAIGTQVLLMDPILRLGYGSFRQSFALLAGAACLIFPYQLAQANWTSVDLHNDTDPEIFVHQVLTVVKPNAVVLSWWGPSTALWYGHFAEGLRPDVEILDESNAVPLGWPDLTPAVDLYFGKRPIYAIGFPDELERYGKKYQLKQVAELHSFGLKLHEVVGRKQAPPTKAP